MSKTVAAIANPGVAERPTPPRICQYTREPEEWQLVLLKDVELDPSDEGVVRISLGAPCTFENVWSLMRWPLGMDVVSVPRWKGGSMLNDIKRWWMQHRTPIVQRDGVAG